MNKALGDLILFHYRKECFKRIEVCDGTPTKDTYAKFFRWDVERD